jgi:hypothetical protein
LVANASANSGTTKRVFLTIGGTQSTWEITTAVDPQAITEPTVVKELGSIEPKIVEIKAEGIVGKTL